MGKLTGGSHCLLVHPRKYLGPHPQYFVLVLGGPHETDSCPLTNFWTEEGPSRSSSQDCICPWTRKAPDGQGEKPKAKLGKLNLRC